MYAWVAFGLFRADPSKSSLDFDVEPEDMEIVEAVEVAADDGSRASGPAPRSGPSSTLVAGSFFFSSSASTTTLSARSLSARVT